MAGNGHSRKMFFAKGDFSSDDVYQLWGYRGQTRREAEKRLCWSFARAEMSHSSYTGEYVEGVNNREFNVICHHFERTLHMTRMRINVEVLCRRGHKHVRRNVYTWVHRNFPGLPRAAELQQTAMPQNPPPNKNTPVPQPSGTVPQQVPMPQNPHSNMNTPNPPALRTRHNQTTASQNAQLNEMPESGGSSPPNYEPLPPLFGEHGNLDSDPPSNGPNFGPST